MREQGLASARLRNYLLASLFAGLTAAGAFIRIPTPYVPITLQTFFVLLSGTLLGPRYGPLSQILYLAVGLAGAPVFTHGGGPAYVLQPTFGYLLSFPPAAYVVGKLLEPAPARTSEITVAAGLGVLLNLSLGAAVLYLNLRYLAGQEIGLSKILVSYFLLFLPGEALKVAAVVFVTGRVYRVTQGFVTT